MADVALVEIPFTSQAPDLLTERMVCLKVVLSGKARFGLVFGQPTVGVFCPCRLVGCWGV